MNSAVRGWRRFAAGQFRLSAAIDRRLVPARDRRDAFADFRRSIVNPLLRPGATVYDVGGGRSPFLAAQAKGDLGLRVIGLDIDARELEAAPAWSYDATVHADITAYRGAGDGDLAICQTVLEHVASTRAALAGLASLLRPGGRAAIFVPSATAAFARLNRLVPPHAKRWILDAVWPDDHDHNGFPARYDSCTPRALPAACRAAALQVELVVPYFLSYYFYCCAPAHLIWRLGANACRRVRGADAAQYVAVVVSKPGPRPAKGARSPGSVEKAEREGRADPRDRK